MTGENDLIFFFFRLFVGQPNVPSYDEWLIKILPPNSRIGIDPFLIQASEFHRIHDKLQEKGHKLLAIPQNLVDLVWKNRPQPKLKPLEPLELRFSGNFLDFTQIASK